MNGRRSLLESLPQVIYRSWILVVATIASLTTWIWRINQRTNNWTHYRSMPVRIRDRWQPRRIYENPQRPCERIQMKYQLRQMLAVMDRSVEALCEEVLVITKDRVL